MSDLDERLARWKAQTATLKTPPELKERLKQTTSASAAAKGAMSGVVKAGVIVMLALVVAVGVRFWPRQAEVEKPVAPAAVPVDVPPPSPVGATLVPAPEAIVIAPVAVPAEPKTVGPPPAPVLKAGPPTSDLRSDFEAICHMSERSGASGERDVCTRSSMNGKWLRSQLKTKAAARFLMQTFKLSDDEAQRKAIVEEAARHGVSPCPVVPDDWILCL